MKKRVNFTSRVTNSFESSLSKISKFYKSSEKKTEKGFQKTLVINPAVAKLTFVFLMVSIFLSLTYKGSASLNSVTTHSTLNQANPGAGFAIFFGLLVLVFVLIYERKKFK